MKRVGVLLCLTFVLSGEAARAEDLSPTQQSLLFLRVLAYDRNLKSRANGTVTVAVLYRAGKPESEQARNGVVAALEEIAKKVAVAGLPVRVAVLEFVNPVTAASRLQELHASAAYVCSGLGDATSDLMALMRKHSILSGTAMEASVRSGLSVGLLAREGKPGLLINLPAAKAEGADFDAALLRLAEVIK